MPDRFGFDHLGESVRCIDCSAGGPIYAWTQRDRERHFAMHERNRQKAAAARARSLRAEAARRLRQVNRLRKEART